MLKIKFPNQNQFFKAAKLLSSHGYRTLGNSSDSRRGCTLELRIIVGRFQNPNAVYSHIASLLTKAKIEYVKEN
jgi:hypothetical protein